jgi:hypothetical protein
MDWYYSKGGKQEGPVDTEELRAKIGSSEVAPVDLVWREGMAAWMPAGEISELASGGESGPGSSGTLGAGPGVVSPVPETPEAPGSNLMTEQPMAGLPLIIAPPPTSGLALASMICGIVAIPLCYVWAVAGIPAVVCGHLALKAIRKSPEPVEGRGFAIAGLVMGWLAIFFQIMLVILVIWASVRAVA